MASRSSKPVAKGLFARSLRVLDTFGAAEQHNEMVRRYGLPEISLQTLQPGRDLATMSC